MSEANAETIWSKAIAVLKRAGREVGYLAFKVWYVAGDPRTPPHIKAILYGALAYLALPLDAIPDPTPIVGFSDDLAALGAALLAANAHCSEEAEAQATAAANRMFS